MKYLRKYSKKIFLTLLTILIIVNGWSLFNLKSAKAVGGNSKELTNVISNVVIWNNSKGEEVTPDEKGIYRLRDDKQYSFQMGFDLTAYDNNLYDGDYFTLNIPAPLTVRNSTFNLVDKETNLTIGEAVITSSGKKAGGVVKVTLKNLEEYLKAKKASEVSGVKGSMYVKFETEEIETEETITVQNIKTIGQISFTIKVKKANKDNSKPGIGKENISKYGGVLTKKNYESKILNKKGEWLHHWRSRINASQKQYNELVIKDNIVQEGGPMQFIPESVVLRKGSGVDESGYKLIDPVELKEGIDYTITYNSSYTSFVVTIPNAGNSSYFLDYETTAPADGSTVGNEVSLSSEGKDIVITDTDTQTKTTITRLSKITEGGTIQLEVSYRIVLYKIDEKTGEPLQGAIFKITKPDGTEITLQATDEGGRTYSEPISEKEAKSGEFTVTEVKAPNGYVISKEPFKVTVTEAGVIRTITNKKETTEYTVTKKWVNGDENNRPLVKFQLKRDGENFGEVKTLSPGETSVKWVDLPKHQDSDLTKESVYTVEELPVDGYISSKSEETKTGVTVTNTYSNNEKVEISGKKVWVDYDNKLNKRPSSIDVTLLRNGVEFQTKSISGVGNEWNFTFDNLLKYDDQGNLYNYKIKELKVPKFYNSKIDNETNTITNTYDERIAISGTKTWEDNNDQDRKRPETIRVKLLANGVEKETKEVTKENNWSYSFENLPKYENGKEVVYTIDEDQVEGYTKKVEGYNLTNSYTPEVVKVEGVKTWEDNNDQDRKRPETIRVKLLANGVEKETKEVTKENNWSYSFENLPKHENGKEVVYTIDEDQVEGYTKKVEGYNLTNSYTPEVVKVEGVKIWEDNNDQDRKRPETIRVKLLANGVEKETKEVTKENNWSYSFENLPKYENGKEVVYTIDEDQVEGYTKKVEGYNLTNSYTPEVVKVEGVKIWEDNNDQDRKRPETIRVKLLANGVEKETKEVTKENNWSYSFENLPKYENGKEVVYTIDEDQVEGYTKKVEGYNLTNSYTPEVVKVEGVKTWEDNSDQDRKRPESIKVKLLADGKVKEEKTVTKENNWSYSFENLPKYENGKEVVYTIDEDQVEGYTKKVEGYNLTNSYTPENIDLHIEKVWDDSNDKDNIRPKDITINLLADGEKVETVKLNDGNNWKYQFKNLPKYKNGKIIEYTVVEDQVEGYESTIKKVGNNIKITNTHKPVTPPPPQTEKPKKKILSKTGQNSNGLEGLVGVIMGAIVLLRFKRKI